MIKTVAIVSLSAGTIGKDFVKHEVNIGLKRIWIECKNYAPCNEGN